jgi:hypothetical protein
MINLIMQYDGDAFSIETQVGIGLHYFEKRPIDHIVLISLRECLHR